MVLPEPAVDKSVSVQDLTRAGVGGRGGRSHGYRSTKDIGPVFV